MPSPKVYKVLRLNDIKVPPFPPSGKIILPVVYRNALLFWYSADIHATLKDLMLLTELYTRTDYSAFAFICNRSAIHEYQTPAELGLSHGDVVLLRYDRRFRKAAVVEFSPAVAKTDETRDDPVDRLMKAVTFLH